MHCLGIATSPNVGIAEAAPNDGALSLALEALSAVIQSVSLPRGPDFPCFTLTFGLGAHDVIDAGHRWAESPIASVQRQLSRKPFHNELHVNE